jgi:hypothetical protein
MIQRTMASKEDITEVNEDMKAMEGRLTTPLDRIEHLLLAEQKQKIADSERRMKRLEDALAV